MYPDPRYQSPEPNRPSLAPRRVRPAHVAAAAAVAVAAIGLMGLKFVTLPEAAPVAPGDALKIEVVTPVEPKVRPGSVMDVGELVDGFRYVPPAPRERFKPFDIAWEDDDLDLAPYAPPVRRAEVRRYASYDEGYRAEREPPRREREERRWFGFDNPMPDYRAERRARQARLEAMEAERRAQFEAARVDRRRYAPPPPRGRAPEPAIGRPIDEPTEGPWGPEVG